MIVIPQLNLVIITAETQSTAIISRNSAAATKLDDDNQLRTLTLENGVIEMKDQLYEYQYRGFALSSLNLLDFILNTYEGKLSNNTNSSENTETRESSAGRPPNPRTEYLSAADKGDRCRITRTIGHETLPRIAGSWFPRNDRENEKDMHRACMLAILKPWRDLTDLKNDNQTFESQYNVMLSSLSRKHSNFIQNAQYYYECIDDAREERANSDLEIYPTPYDPTATIMPTKRKSDKGWLTVADEEISQDLIQFARQHRKDQKEILFGDAAVDEGFKCGFFNEDQNHEVNDEPAPVAGIEDLHSISRWERELQAVTKRMVAETGTLQIEQTSEIEESITNLLRRPNSFATSYHTTPLDDANVTNPRPKLAMLNKGQRRAHDIIEERLKQHMEGKRPFYTLTNLKPQILNRDEQY